MGYRNELIRLLPFLVFFGMGAWWLTSQRDRIMHSPNRNESTVSEQGLFQFSDPKSAYSFQEILRLPSQDWKEVRAVNFGYKGGAGWVRSNIYSPYQQTVLLELQSHFIDALTVWLVAETDTAKKIASTGYRELSLAPNNPLLHRYFTFEIPFEAGQYYKVFIRGSTAPGFTLKYAIRYWEPAVFRAYFRNSDWDWGIFIGITLVAVFIALTCFVIHGQRIYIYYAAYISSLTLYALLSDGWGIFLPDSLNWVSDPILIAHFLNSGICFLLLFSREFLVVPRKPTQWWLRIRPWWLWALITGCILLTHQGYSQHHETLTRMGYWLGIAMASTAGLLWTTYWWDAVRREFNPAWLLLASQLVMFLFCGTNIFLVNMNARTLAYPDMYIFRIALILGLLIIAVGWIYRQKLIRQSQQQLQDTNESQRQAVREAERLLQEEEIKALRLENELHNQRERLARDLHDGIGSQLSHITSRLDMLSLSPSDQTPELFRLSDFIRGTNRNLRETIWILNRESIPFDDFSARLHSFLRMAWDNHNTPLLTCKCHHPEDPVLPPTVALHLFRIVQEATVNAFKYAPAAKVAVQLEHHPSQIKLIVSDDGGGFEYNSVSNGFGLTNMQNRTAEMQGDFKLVTNGSGTQIRVTVPLSA